MKHPKSIRRIQALFPFLIFALVPLWGCDIFDEGGTPETAKVVLEGGGGESFQLVTTNDFLVTADEDGENREVYLNSADTAVVSAPFSKSYSLGSGVRFYVKAISEEGLSQPVTIKVFINGDQRFNSTSTLLDLALEFIFTFR